MNYLTAILNIINKVIAFILIAILMPLFLCIASLILILDGKPIFYKQVRLGQNMKPFTLYKFRTMKVNSYYKKQVDKKYPLAHDTQDPRVTRLGKILRKLSIDELPQLWNILKGDMNFVGVRPLIEEESKLVSKEHFKYKPGLTGPTQIYRTDNLTIEKINKLEADFNNKYTLKTKLIIVLKTFKVIWKGI